MINNLVKNILSAAFCTLLLMIPSIIMAQTEQKNAEPPPIEQIFVRQGELALRLVSALAVGNATGEAEAVSLLTEAGIKPKKGWMTDYPVTPAIADELRSTVAAAVDNGKIPMDKEKALEEFDDILMGLGIPVTPFAGVPSNENGSADVENNVEPIVVYTYYYNEGPPDITYYPPPPNYANLYAWVPYNILLVI